PRSRGIRFGYRSRSSSIECCVRGSRMACDAYRPAACAERVRRFTMVRSLSAAVCLAAALASAESTGANALARIRTVTGSWQGTSEGNDLVPALKPFGFLKGDWDAVPGPAGETGAFSFKPGAQGHILVRTNFASYPASAGKPASRHDDL